MTRISLSLFTFALCLTVLMNVAGCGSAPPRTVTGKVVLLPNTKTADTDAINVMFIPEDKSGKTVVGDVSPKDLTFTASVPSGKYKVSLGIQPYPGEKDSEKREAALETIIGPFGPDKTPLTYEVTSDSNQDITIDLARGSVTKN